MRLRRVRLRRVRLRRVRWAPLLSVACPERARRSTWPPRRARQSARPARLGGERSGSWASTRALWRPVHDVRWTSGGQVRWRARRWLTATAAEARLKGGRWHRVRPYAAAMARLGRVWRYEGTKLREGRGSWRGGGGPQPPIVGRLPARRPRPARRPPAPHEPVRGPPSGARSPRVQLRAVRAPAGHGGHRHVI